LENETQKSAVRENLSALQKFDDIQGQFFDSCVAIRGCSKADCANDAFLLNMG
jgi:hypothetical protein